jgi:hypothetical protein
MMLKVMLPAYIPVSKELCGNREVLFDNRGNQ